MTSLEVRAAVVKLLLQRIAGMLECPDVYGGAHAVECQVLLAQEVLHVVHDRGDEAVNGVVKRWSRFCGPGSRSLADKYEGDAPRFAEELRRFLQSERDLFGASEFPMSVPPTPLVP